MNENTGQPMWRRSAQWMVLALICAGLSLGTMACGEDDEGDGSGAANNDVNNTSNNDENNDDNNDDNNEPNNDGNNDPNGCTSNADCGEEAFCLLDDGICDGEGTCEPRGDGACPEIFAPVCGCDGETYGNACEAAFAGASVLHAGECDAGPLGCQDSNDCGDDEHCAKPAGECGAEGQCEPRPDGCDDVFEPVCGCDGQTYGNACEAAAVGMSVEFDGECERPSLECDTTEDCPPDFFCECDGESCGEGLCAPSPDGCDDVFEPVCGCDGQIYANDCERQSAGTCLADPESCDEPSETCTSNEECGEGNFCDFEPGSCDEDRIGACSPRPEVCTEEFAPVCGCDGVTYDNDCFRRAAGASVASRGACDSEPTECETSRECGEGNFCECEGDACGAGTCQVRPEACPRNIDPVCGCDNETYSNDCIRQQAGVCLLHDGECEEPGDTCIDNGQCDRSQYCEFEPGTCGRTGQCVQRPQACLDIFAPVCGCDGVTYGNGCQAANAGVSVANEGACEDEPGECFDNGQCDRGQFCEFEAGTCDQDRAGLCEARPEFCPENIDPVCGCDGETYNNDCERQVAGVGLDSRGACDDPQEGCRDNEECGRGQVCAFEPGTCNDIERLGECTARPMICPAVVIPVCGCNGQTYNNSCEALADGISVAYEGACLPDEDICTDNRQCGEGQFCECVGDACGAGTCRERPEACPRVIDPVCGCDGETYSNDCIRQAAGVCLEHEGECGEPNNECEDNGDCGRGQFCNAEPETCGAGVCEERPLLCPDVFAPVCGCDGETYDNACQAAASGVAVASEGACGQGETCGGFFGGQCEEGQLCDPRQGFCNVPDIDGICVDVPRDCPDIFEPVCGCDGVTYPNDCERLQRGVGLDREGACEDLGCTDNGQCSRDQFCEFTDLVCGEGEPGQCTARPFICPDVVDPVCGCDGRTYGNDCERQAAGVSKAADGPCER